MRGRVLARHALLAGAVGVLAWQGISFADARTTTPAACSSAATSAGATVTDRPDGTVGIQACLAGTHAADGSVAASANPRTRQGYAVFQGRPGQRTPPGYEGVDTQNGLTIVGCWNGTYDPRHKDAWNQKPGSRHNNAQISVGTGEFTAPSGPIGGSSPCSPFYAPQSSKTPKTCGSKPPARPATSVPPGSPLRVYSAKPSSQSGQVGIAGDFGGGKGASGFLQVTYEDGGGVPRGNLTTGGNSRAGGGTVAIGNDGKETDDPFTPKSSPVTICQD